ncbi:MAG: radical SAM protein [Mollicutes bacterium]|nr:radical SAM protein [Mollicutes bacterium]
MKKYIKYIMFDYPYVSLKIRYITKKIFLYIKYYKRRTREFLLKISRKLYINKPKVLQFPITYKCNFDCVMCGMQKMAKEKDIDIHDIEEILSNKLFNQIRSVGLNGGEPFIVQNLEDYVKILIKKLPKLKYIYLITNGYLTDRILTKLRIIKSECKKHNIRLTVSVSLDGIGKTHDIMRGRSNIFNNVENTCITIKNNQKEFCDDFGVICTITKHNIININEVDYWATKNNVNIAYNIATIHKRLFNEDRYEDFSVLTDDYYKLLTIEWFYYKFKQTNSEQYYNLYRYLLDNKRIAKCDYQNDGITILPNGDLSFCATQSKIIGNALSEPANLLFKNNILYRKQLMENKCAECSHYSGTVSINKYEEYIRELLQAYNYRLR